MGHELLNEFPVQVETRVAWGEMDAFGHVNNIIFFRYFENARIAYFNRIGLIDNAKQTGIGPILAKTSCRFRKPLVYPDTVLVGTRVTHLNPDRFQQEYRVVSKKENIIVAEGESVTVAFEYARGLKSEYPKVILDAILALEGKTLPPLAQK